MWGRIKINKMVQWELAWFIEHVQQSSGLFFFKLMVWQEGDVGHFTLTIHVDVSAWGLGIWFLSEKKGYQCPLPILHLTDAIFFSKALLVCSAVHISECFPGAMHLLIATDNTNTFDIFTSLSTQPAYNPILILAVNVLLCCNVDLRVVYILGPLNHVTDALLWYQNDLVRKLVPAIQIKNFTPPWDALGAVKKWYWYPHCWGNLPGLLGCYTISITSSPFSWDFLSITPLLLCTLPQQTLTFKPSAKKSPIHRTYCQDPQLLHHLPNPLYQPQFCRLLLVWHHQPTQTILSWCPQTARVPSSQVHLEGSLKTVLQRGPLQKAFICSWFGNHASTFSRVNLLQQPSFQSTTQHWICGSPSAGRIS